MEMIEYKEFRNHMVHDNIDDFMQYCGENVQVADYLPIGRKYAIIDMFGAGFSYIIESMLNEHNYSFSDVLMEYELKKMFDVFFKYTNITFDIEYSNSMEYDLIHQSYFYTYVMQFCSGDYECLCKELDTVVGINDFSIINTFNNKLNIPTIDDINRMQDMINNIDTEKLAHIADIVKMNDPLVNNVADIIKQDVKNDTAKKLKEQKKFEVIDGGEETIRDR